MKYSFDGKWNFKIKLQDFSELTFENETKEIEFIIRDFIDDEFEPFEQQINTINFIFDNQKLIIKKMIDMVIFYLRSKIRKMY